MSVSRTFQIAIKVGGVFVLGVAAMLFGRPRIKRMMIAILLLAIGTSATVFTFKDGLAAEQSQCPQMPTVSWWSNSTHEKLIRYVNRKHGGDWSPYIAYWEKHMNKVMKAFEQGKGLAIPRNKVDLSSGEVQRKGSVKEDKVILAYEDLGLYIPKIVQRIAVQRCLANEMKSRTKLQKTAVLPPLKEEEGSSRPMEEVLGYGWVLKTKCGPIPDIEWWKFRTHKSIAGYVIRKHGGDWKPYMENWTLRLVMLEDMYDRRSSVVVSTGLTLKGLALKTYLEQTRNRLSVIRCLAAEAAADKARKLATGQ